MINIKDLTYPDIGKVVVYHNPNTGGQEYGAIKSWNTGWIFVNYFLKVEKENIEGMNFVSERCGETAEATNAAHLVFVFPWQIPAIRSKR